MSFRLVIALFMGLFIQLSQVQTFGAGLTDGPCAKAAQSMDCCEGLKSCHCAKDNDSDQKPAPLAVVELDLKLLFSKAPEAVSLATLIPPTQHSVLVAASVYRIGGGFAGVPLSVAFCSFVI